MGMSEEKGGVATEWGISRPSLGSPIGQFAKTTRISRSHDESIARVNGRPVVLLRMGAH